LKILLSAFACRPGDGSERGIGWHWAEEIARLGHEVHVLTRMTHAPFCERSAKELGLAMVIHGYDLPRWATWWKSEKTMRGTRFYYLLWQWRAYPLARDLHDRQRFDLVHQITFGAHRYPSFMGRLGIPFILGPIGGGEVSPAALLRSAPFKPRVFEYLRSIGNRIAALDPLVQKTFKQATLIFCKTQETKNEIPAALHHKCAFVPDVGAETALLANSPSPGSATPKFLYAGRLFYWKGIHLVLRALAQVRRQMPDATMVIVGQGADSDWLRALANELGISGAVTWPGWLARKEVMGFYSSCTAFTFPSLHDSGGTVVLEALSQGLPVICLDLGGPGQMLPEDCGFKISTAGQTEEQVIGALAEAMMKIGSDASTRREFGENALKAARAQTWQAIVARAYELIEQALAAR
jgi:glycosyltransferase involved in cell wall biosynthesis